MRTLFLACLCLASVLSARAQTTSGESIHVLLRVAPPFVIEEENGEYSGISVDLWRRMAGDLRVAYEFEVCDLNEMLDRVAAGDADVGVGATTVTAEREAILDFTHPFVTSGLAIAIRSSDSAWTTSLMRVFSWDFARAVAALALLLLGVGFLMWTFERRRNPEQFEPQPGRGLWSAFWFAAVTMTTVGYGDKAPQSAGGRIVAIVWMFTSIIVISFFTASIATVLTVGSLDRGIEGPSDLPGLKVGALERSTSAEYLVARDLDAVMFQSVAEAVSALARGEVEAVVHDDPILRWAIRESDDRRLQLLPSRIERQDYAFVLPPNDPRREELNRSLLQEIESPGFQRTLTFYLGE